MNSTINSKNLNAEFLHWLENHRGVQKVTQENYSRSILRFLSRIKGDLRRISAANVRRYIRNLGKDHQFSSVKTHVNAIRMFLKFLVVSGQIDPSMLNAIPQFRQPTPENIPKYFNPELLESVSSIFDGDGAINQRNKAILMLLTRLGLRASEISNLKLQDIDWEFGRIRIAGKSRKDARLPLPQDAGNAILQYLKESRPNTDSSSIFLKAAQPHTSLTRSAIKHVAKKAINKAEIYSPSKGSHVFRHTAATSWLRKGMSLQAIGTVLGHSSVETTAIYAKVDLALLSEVVQPWPIGGELC